MGEAAQEAGSSNSLSPPAPADSLAEDDDESESCVVESDEDAGSDEDAAPEGASGWAEWAK